MPRLFDERKQNTNKEIDVLRTQRILLIAKTGFSLHGD